MSRCVVHIVRHGQSEWNERGLLQGQHADVGLTPVGHGQASQTAKLLSTSGAARVLSSDQRRAVQTAQPIADRLGVPLHLRPELREQSVGVFQGRPIHEVWAETGRESWRETGWRPPEGESLADVALRLQPLLHELEGDDGPVVLVTHGDTARIVWGLLSGYPVDAIPPLALGNGEIVTVAGLRSR